MMKQPLLTLALFVALLVVAPTLTTAQTPTSRCLRTFREIFDFENALDDEGTGIFRTYTICPNTLLEPGIPDVNGQIINDDLPLSCKENCLVRCGVSGSSSNNCKIDGTGPLAVYQIPLFIFENIPDSSENVIFQGFTLDFFVNDKQRPVIMGAAFGDVTYIDWIFSNNNADPFFVIQQLAYPGYAIKNNRAAGRSANIDGADNVFGRSANITDSATPTKIPKGYIHPDKFTASISSMGGRGGGQRPPRRRMLEDANILDIRTPEERDAMRRESYADKYIDEILMPDEREEERRLQAVTSIYRVSFVDCLFDFNAPVRLAKTQFGLSVLRFSGADVFYLYGVGNGGPDEVDVVGNMDVRLVRNEFVDNIYSLGDDLAAYRSLIDFYSSGRLTMRQNCFIRSPVKNFGVVTMNTDGTVVNTRNFLDEVQEELDCPFVAYMTDVYTLQSCGPRATAFSCRAKVPTTAPSAAPGSGGGLNSGGGGGLGGFCFPGDATVQVLLGGAAAKSVQMKHLKVGDKVLVADGKYEPIYSFGHYAQGSEAEYVKLGMTDGKSIELSRDHMLFVQGRRVVPASTIKIGDQVALGGSDEKEQTYTSVKTIAITTKQEGAFAPFTASGSVVVNGIKASSFVAFQDSETLAIGGGDNHVLFDTGLTFQFLAHTFEGPHRTWCQYVSSCTEERYTAEGISTWVALPYKLFVWFHAQNTCIMAVMMVPISILFGVLANPAVVLAIMLGTALLRSTTMRIKRA